MLYSQNRQYRTKIKGRQHIKVKKIRGNHSNIVYTLLEYIRFNTNNKTNMFLKFYPEYKDIYEQTKQKVDILTDEILHEYTELKKIKNKSFRNSHKYKKAIKELHSQYIYLIKAYNPKRHAYKPNINQTKIKHYLIKEINITYLVYLLSTL